MSASYAAAASSSSATPSASTPLHELFTLIDQWGLSVWHAQKIAGSTTAVPAVAAAAASANQLLVPCTDDDWVVQKGLFISNMLRLKTLCSAAIAQHNPQPARVRNYCQCRSDEPCKNNHCKCRNKDKFCSSKCACKGKCGNIPPSVPSPSDPAPSFSHRSPVPLLHPIPPLSPFSSVVHDRSFGADH